MSGPLPRRRWYWSLRLEFKAADCWIGAFWKNQPGGLARNHCLDIWVCVVPMLPLHLRLMTLGAPDNQSSNKSG